MEEKTGATFLERHESKIAVAIIFAGIVFRFAQFLANRALWHDEACLALNITGRGFAGLFLPLDHSQGAPIGFLLVQKLFTVMAGTGEYGLRLFPLLSGLAALFLFYRVARAFAGPAAALIALGLFACSENLIYYSSEAKQYQTDVAVALLLFWSALQVRDAGFRRGPLLAFGLIGVLCVWFSHASVFVLAAAGLTLLLDQTARKARAGTIRLSLVFLAWLASFLAVYAVSLRALGRNPLLLEYWQGAFMPLPPANLHELSWFAAAPLKFFKFVLGFSAYKMFGSALFLDGFSLSALRALTPARTVLFMGMSGLTALYAALFVIGAVMAYREKDGRRVFSFLMLPFAFTLAASGLGKYPFSDRMILFLMPPALILIARAVRGLMPGGRFRVPAAVLLLTAVFVWPASLAAFRLAVPRMVEEVRPLFRNMVKHRRAGEPVYVYYTAWPAFAFYAPRYGIGPQDYFTGLPFKDNSVYYREDAARLAGRGRVWLFFSHLCPWKGVDEEAMFLARLDKTGKRIRSWRSVDAALHLYEFP